VNQVWAALSILPFFRVTISGRENLPKSSTGAVYVANHQSIMDIFVLFLLGKPFKFVSKIEVFYVPIIGLAMFLTGKRAAPISRGGQLSLFFSNKPNVCCVYIVVLGCIYKMKNTNRACCFEADGWAKPG
jgi:hypothetical protein